MSGFKIPLDFSHENFYEKNLQTKEDKNEENLKKSIEDFILLLVTSPNGSFKPNFRFGFSMKNYRFENTDSEDKINNERIRGKSNNFNNFFAIYLKETIKLFEPRLQTPEVEIGFDRQQSRVTISVSGTIIDIKKAYNQKIIFHIW